MFQSSSLFRCRSSVRFGVCVNANPARQGTEQPYHSFARFADRRVEVFQRFGLFASLVRKQSPALETQAARLTCVPQGHTEA